MAKRYEAAKPPRFRIETSARGERIRIPARRQYFALAFLPVWLVGGIAAMAELARTGEAFLAIWLAGWAVGWIAVAGILVWMIAGSETMQAVQGDLEIGESLFGWTRVRIYRGTEIRDLAAAAGPPFFQQFRVHVPFVMPPQWGSVKFNYGARTNLRRPGPRRGRGQDDRRAAATRSPARRFRPGPRARLKLCPRLDPGLMESPHRSG